MSSDPIIWTGDLEDDCVARWRGMVAHAEALDHDYWYASVDAPDGEQLYHSAESGDRFSSGTEARAECERVMRAHVASKGEAR